MQLKPSDEFFEDEEVTKVDAPEGWQPVRRRRDGDERIETVILQRPPGGTAIRFYGAGALAEACLMLDAWSQKTKRGELSEVSFAIHFGDGLIYSGVANVHHKKSRDLAARLRDPESFCAALCPTSNLAEAGEKFALFATQYAIGVKLNRSHVRRLARFFGIAA